MTAAILAVYGRKCMEVFSSADLGHIEQRTVSNNGKRRPKDALKLPSANSAVVGGDSHYDDWNKNQIGDKHQ
jgi:hypothetical protein